MKNSEKSDTPKIFLPCGEILYPAAGTERKAEGVWCGITGRRATRGTQRGRHGRKAASREKARERKKQRRKEKAAQSAAAECGMKAERNKNGSRSHGRSAPGRRMLLFFFRRRFPVAVLLLLQLGAFGFLLFSGSLLSGILGTLLRLLSILVALAVIARPDSSGYKLLWLFLLLLLPLFGGAFYLLLRVQSATPRLDAHDRRLERSHQNLMLLADPCGAKIEKEKPALTPQLVFLRQAGYPVYRDTRIVYLPSGEETYGQLLSCLRRAERYIFLEYFIIDDGRVWRSVRGILRQKAAEGVDVRVLMDDGGCFFLHPRRMAEELRAEGIGCCVFNPFRPIVSAVQNNRDHRKIAVVDGKMALTGGMNLADEYVNGRVLHGHWKDSAVLLRGPAAWGFTVMFLRMWTLSTGKDEGYTRFYPSDMPRYAGEGYAAPYASGPRDLRPVSVGVFRHLIGLARRYVYIMTPYLIPDDTLADALKLAAQSGVDVRILTPGIGDKRFVQATTRSFYPPLLHAGVRIFEYTPGFLHAKSICVDDMAATVGSANFDFRSLYLNYECGALIAQPSVARAVREDFLRTAAQGREIHLSEERPGPVRILTTRLLRLLAPLM